MRGANGSAVPSAVVGQGTWQMAERRDDRDDEIAALRAGIARGLTHIDTAELYGGGSAEELIARGDRGCAATRAVHRQQGAPPQRQPRRAPSRACEQSLRRLGTDHLDVYLLHWRGSLPLAETLGALEDLVDQGKIRALGVSNFDVGDLEEARALLTRHPIACNQVLYHLGERHIDTDLVDYCAKHRHRRRRLQPVRARAVSVAERRRRPRARRRRGAPRRHAPSGGARVPGPQAAAVHDPEGVGRRARRGERRRAAPALTAADIAEIDAAFPIYAGSELPVI